MEIGANYGKSLTDLTNPGTGKVESRELGQQDFLKIMLEQMRHQNPLEPQDNSQFFAQIAQFDTLDTMREIASALKSLASVSEIANASALVGRTVTAEFDPGPDPETGMPRDPEHIEGLVERVSFRAGEATVQVNGRTIPTSAIQEVS